MSSERSAGSPTLALPRRGKELSCLTPMLTEAACEARGPIEAGRLTTATRSATGRAAAQREDRWPRLVLESPSYYRLEDRFKQAVEEAEHEQEHQVGEEDPGRHDAQQQPF